MILDNYLCNINHPFDRVLILIKPSVFQVDFSFIPCIESDLS